MKRYNDEFKKIVLDFYRAGKTFDEITRLMSVSTGTVIAWAKAAGIPTRRSNLENKKDDAIKGFREGKSVREIASEAGVSQVTIYNWARAAGVSHKRQTPLKEIAIEQFKKGIPVSVIADQSGVTQATIYKWVKSAGIPVYRSPLPYVSEKVLKKHMNSTSIVRLPHAYIEKYGVDANAEAYLSFYSYKSKNYAKVVFKLISGKQLTLRTMLDNIHEDINLRVLATTMVESAMAKRNEKRRPGDIDWRTFGLKILNPNPSKDGNFDILCSMSEEEFKAQFLQKRT